jgi:hypothetical protein
MKVTTIALAAAFALTSTLAFAQTTTGTEGYGSVVQPSVGSYVWPSVGSTLAVPTWRNTGPAAPLPSSPAFSPIPVPAPVGHRQPRADQVPSENLMGDPKDPMNRENAKLDRAVKSICRGC